MSKIGKLIINIPPGVTVAVNNNLISVTGPKGQLEMSLPLKVNLTGQSIQVIEGDSNLWGLTRTLIANLIAGVATGWTKTLELSGTGYRASAAGDNLQLALGFSHPVNVQAPAGIAFEAKENKITVSGADKSLVGQIAARIRAIRPADVYKHKGFRYEGEKLIKKAGKAAKAGVPTAAK